MKRSIFTQMITWLCILSFGMHVVLHLGPAFPWGTGHSGHGDDRHSLVNYGVSNNSIQSRSEFDAGLNITEYLVSSNHSHHTPADHNPEPEDHDPTHHLTIQYRATCQISYDPFDAHLQHKFLSESTSTNTQPSIEWTGRDVAVDFNPYVKCIRLIL